MPKAALEPTEEHEMPAGIDYRLRARAVVRGVQSGNIFRSEVCDAHPELLRVAKGAGVSCGTPCPICESDSLVALRYMFGAKLGPSGRCVADVGEIRQILNTKKGRFTCYVVEVCTECSWNYLIQSIPLLGRS